MPLLFAFRSASEIKFELLDFPVAELNLRIIKEVSVRLS